MMRISIAKLGLLALAVGLTLHFSACSKKETSRTTGWNYNDPDMGGFQNTKYIEEETGPGLVFIEGGTFVMGATQDKVVFNADNKPRRVTVRSFYMDQTEITNLDYLEYLYWLNRVYGENYHKVYTNALPDTMVWRTKLAYNEPLVENYLRHPAYKNYPVVGVSWVQATEYAKWRTDRVNEARLVEEEIISMNLEQKDANHFNTEAYLAGQYEAAVADGGDSKRARREDGFFLPSYRLPTEAEWEFAALGLVENTDYEKIRERKVYPWNGSYLRTNDRKYYGNFVANFKRGRGDYMGVAGSLNDGAAIPTEVGSYFPNDYGLYNMGGNVSEWVLDIYRPSTFQDMDDMQGFRGNVFTVMMKDEDGFLVPKDSLGRMRYREITPEEAKGRRNYREANNVNYLDGDPNSLLRSDNQWAAQDSIIKESTTEQMYGYGKTSLINDESRVYKGGSWRDPAYYLSPSARRFLNQNEATNYIGFRCAMNSVGRQQTQKRHKKLGK